MKKAEFIAAMEKQLRQQNVGEIEDILQEYEDHFTFKGKDGYTEEEIAAKLGSPQAIAAQYAVSAVPGKRSPGLKLVAGTGLFFVDIVSFSFLLALYAFSAVLAALAAGSLALAVSYAFGLNPYGILPPMPVHCALAAAVPLLGLTALSALCVYFWTTLVTQLTKAYLRYRKNFMAAITGSARQLPYPVRMQMPPKVWRTLRKVLLISLCVFVFGFVALYVLCAASAGALGWWHAWNWFV